MKIHWKKITLFSFAAIVATLLCNSCDSQVSDEPGPDNPQNVDTEMGYFSLGLSWTDAIQTRATEDGLDAERKVNSIYMVLFSNDDKSLKYVTDFGKANNTVGSVFSGDSVYTSSSISGFVSKGILLKKETYKLVVVANPFPTLKTKLDAKTVTWDDVNDHVLALGASAGQVQLLNINNGAFMSNAKGILTLYPTDFWSTPAEAQTTPKQVTIDRIMAKIVVNKGTSFTQPTKGEVTTFKWNVEHYNTKTYLIRKPDLTPTEVAETLLTSRENIYAKDPNFELGEQVGTDMWDDILNIDWNENPAVSEAKYTYVLENTLSKETQLDADWQKYTTNVVVEATIKYPELGTDGELQYYSFINKEGVAKVFSHAQGKEWYANGYERNMSFPADMSGLLEIMRGGYWNFTADTTAPTRYVTHNGLTFHKDGYNKYIVPIKHFNLTGTADRTKYGQYGIVRNNVYKLVVTGIKGPGTPTNNEMYISVDITVNPWYIREQEEHLQ